MINAHSIYQQELASNSQQNRDFLQQPPTYKNLRILIIDDSYADFDDLARCLRKMNAYAVKVTRAKTIEEARYLISEETFDVAFVDFYLGDESGIRLLREFRENSPQVAPILITGMDDEKVQYAALKEGAIGCINKDDISITLLETTLRFSLYIHQKLRFFDQLVFDTSQK